MATRSGRNGLGWARRGLVFGGLLAALALRAEEPALRATGYRALALPPPPARSEAAKTLARTAATPLPAKYSLREQGLLPPVRDQGQLGSCWAHAAIASYESCLRKRYNELADFSENNVTFGTRFDWDPVQGGNNFMAASALLNRLGPPPEALDPYQSTATTNTCSRVSYTLPPARLVGEVIRFYAGAEDFDTQIKRAVMDYGAVAVAYYETQENTEYNASTFAYYRNVTAANAGVNHAVAIVGWDDTFPASNFVTNPGRNGAWIIRNSWGNHRDGGYFYLSYASEDLHIDDAWQYRPLAPEGQNILNNYFHDEFVFYGRATYTNSSSFALANCFTARADEELAYVAILAPAYDYAGTFAIYTGLTGDTPDTGTLKLEQSAAFSELGYHVVKLDRRIPLAAGERFAIVFTQQATSGHFAYETYYKDFNSKIEANAGESYICDSGGPWQTLNFSSPSTPTLRNLCLRGWTVPSTEPAVPYGLYDWLKACGYVPAANDDVASTAVVDYASLASAKALSQATTGLSPLACYQAGLLADEAESGLRAHIAFDEAGNPVLTPVPSAPGRVYTLLGTDSLSSGVWSTDTAGKHFFKFRVGWPTGQ